MKEKLIKRSLVIWLCAAIAVSFSVMLPGNAASAKSKSMKLPTKAVMKVYDDDHKSTTYTYKYNKSGKLIRKTIDYRTTDHAFGNRYATFTITYKSKSSAAAKMKGDTAYWHCNLDFFKLNKKGFVTEWRNCHNVASDLRASKNLTYKGNKLSRIKWYEDDGETYHTKDTWKVTNSKDGRKVTIKGPNDENKPYSEVRKYDKNGLIISNVLTDSSEGEMYTDKYVFKYKKNKAGLVTKKTTYINGKKSSETTYAYGKQKVDKKNYAYFLNEDERSLNSYLF